VNGFKISEGTIYGCMDDKEMVSLFTGYGYQCRFVEDLEDVVGRPCYQLLDTQTNTILGLRFSHKHAIGS